MRNETVIIMGSSSSEGHTARISKHLAMENGWSIIDLNKYNIGYYDYQHENRMDDFIPLIKEILKKYNTLLFSTPVYWYTMSAVMKTFFDRLTDLLDFELSDDFSFRGKQLAVISNSVETHLEYPFDIPFEKSANYLEMEYVGHQHFKNTIENPQFQLKLSK